MLLISHFTIYSSFHLLKLIVNLANQPKKILILFHVARLCFATDCLLFLFSSQILKLKLVNKQTALLVGLIKLFLSRQRILVSPEQPLEVFL